MQSMSKTKAQPLEKRTKCLKWATHQIKLQIKIDSFSNGILLCLESSYQVDDTCRTPKGKLAFVSANILQNYKNTTNFSL